MSSTARLIRREGDTTGLPSYARSHLRASVSFNPAILADPSAPPDTITLTADGLRDPVDPRVRMRADADRLRHRADRARHRADRLTALASRHAARCR